VVRCWKREGGEEKEEEAIPLVGRKEGRKEGTDGKGRK
jgi:hypothetical protein